MVRTRVKEDWSHWGLCSRCTRSMISRDASNKERAWCHAFPEFNPAEIKKPIAACTSYDEKTMQPSLYDMKQIATIIEIGQSGSIGFIRPRDPGHKEIVEKVPDPI